MTNYKFPKPNTDLSKKAKESKSKRKIVLNRARRGRYNFMKLKSKDISGSYNLELEAKTISYVRKFYEWRRRKYMATKIGNEDWYVEELKDFPFTKLPNEFVEEV